MAKRRSPRKAAVPQESAESSGPQRGVERFVPALAVLAATSIVFAVVELALSALISDTALRNGELPLGARMTLAAYSLALRTAGVCGDGALLLLLSRLRRRVGAGMVGAEVDLQQTTGRAAKTCLGCRRRAWHLYRRRARWEGDVRL